MAEARDASPLQIANRSGKLGKRTQGWRKTVCRYGYILGLLCHSRPGEGVAWIIQCQHLRPATLRNADAMVERHERESL